MTANMSMNIRWKSVVSILCLNKCGSGGEGEGEKREEVRVTMGG